MRISILTICPEMFGSLQCNHVIKRAIDLEQLELAVIDIRGYADGCFRKVDDSPYGGGAGMIMRVAPVAEAIRSICTEMESTLKIAFTPTGERFDQKMASGLAAHDHLVFVCGHYEGMDERIYSYVDRTVSVGDYILSGGEIPAMAVADCVARLLPGVLKEGSLSEETFVNGLLEYPQYTRPAVYEGKQVPDVLLSGNHDAIRKWRLEQSRLKTMENRPDLLFAKYGKNCKNSL